MDTSHASWNLFIHDQTLMAEHRFEYKKMNISQTIMQRFK